MDRVKIFFDTEFIERPNTIDLISIGMIDEHGRSIYCINEECNLDLASDWVIENVLKPMPEYNSKLNCFGLNVDNNHLYKRKDIAYQILTMVGDRRPEFWADYCSYDWVALCWLFGPMVMLPKGWPMYCNDIQQLLGRYQKDSVNLPKQTNVAHNALDDAKYVKECYEYFVNVCFEPEW